MTIKTIGLLGVLFCAPALTTTMAASLEATDQDKHVVTGTLTELDLSKMSGKIKTDLERTVAFTIQNPDLFKGLSVGERIAVRLDDQGQVIKVMATILPELPVPEK
jgi:ABC-type transporter Mla maintaining outer membrane lipid asymmetry ATPase subunit MlaF